MLFNLSFLITEFLNIASGTWNSNKIQIKIINIFKFQIVFREQINYFIKNIP